MFIDEAIVQRLKELKDEHKTNFSQWSLNAGVTYSTMSSLLRKNPRVPTIPTLIKLCREIGISLSDFFDTDYIKTAELRTDYE